MLGVGLVIFGQIAWLNHPRCSCLEDPKSAAMLTTVGLKAITRFPLLDTMTLALWAGGISG